MLSFRSISLLCTFLSSACFGTSAIGADKETVNINKGRGVELRLSDGSVLNVSFVRPDIVHVVASHEAGFESSTGICNYAESHPESLSMSFLKSVRQLPGQVVLNSDSLQVTVSTITGKITYVDRKGRSLLSEDAVPHPAKLQVTEQVVYDESTRRIEKTVDGEKERMDVLRRDTVGRTWQYRLQLNFQADEAVYGMGSHMEDYMNLRGKKQFICQHNLKAMVPVLNSTAGYGLLFDAGSEMIFDDTERVPYVEIEATPALSYYFMKGHSMDATVAAYRWLTGDVPMMPLWLFGYTQSKERYFSQDDLVNTLREFRRRHIPIDCIVQDWNYWKDGSWGTMSMEPSRYPDKKKMADDVHALNAKLMVSIWPNMSNSPQHDDFRDRGFFLKGQNVYDAFRPEVRDLYWQYANKEFFQNDFDAWWCDSSEPLDGDWGNRGPQYGLDNHEERWQLQSKKLGDALGRERSQLYSLYHSRGIYEHQRQATSAKRVVNLTRSSYAGEQRYGTIVWNGDTYASWKQFKQMIPAGLNYMATGCPYWSVDVGCFFTRKGWAWFYAGEYPKGCDDPAYREFYVRMLQYATFLPVMRSHGTDTPREPWRFGEPGTAFYDAIMHCINLRYRLLPYSYSLAARVSNDSYTFARCLAFDFPKDSKVHDIKDEFMYGPSILVAPVTDAATMPGESVKRNVYLPAGTAWYEAATGKRYEGGQTICVNVPISQPCYFYRAGSIVPMSEVVEHSDLYTDTPWTVNVFTGRDASFDVYLDAGDGYACENGEYATFKLVWNEKRQTLTLTERQGAYSTVKPLHITIRLNDGRETTLTYTGKKQVVKLNK